MGNSQTKNELERIKIKESTYNQEARLRSLAILKKLKSNEFLDICTIKNKLFDEDKAYWIICQEHLIGFSPQAEAKDPYKSFVEIFKKTADLNFETFYDNEDFVRCKLDDLIRKRIHILLGLSYSFIKHNSFDVCYFIFNGTFNEKYRENIYRNNLREYSLDENKTKKMSLKINDEFYKVIEEKGAENRVFFRCLLEEYNACIEHEFKYDSESRKKSLQILETIENRTKFKVLYKQFSTEIHKDLDEFPKILSKSYYKFISISEIWIITIDKYVIKFNLRPNLKTFGIQFVLEIEKSSSDYKDYELLREEEFEMNDVVRQQLKHVLGMSNHSFLLRNSEHAITYISTGMWTSQQSLKGKIYKQLIEGNIFLNATDYTLKKVYYDEIQEFKNGKDIKFPSRINPIVFDKDKKDKIEKVYSFIDESLFKPTQMQYYLDDSQTTYNVLLIGPTGAGKSRLVNTFFNKNIVKSEAGFNSMTREIYFIKSRKQENGNYNEMILVDTIGLCDTSWEKERVHNYIKSRINNNFQEVDIVLIVISRERLLKDVEDNIRTMLEWLNYERYFERFVFVFTKSAELTDEERKVFREELRKRLSLIEETKDDAILFTDFPVADPDLDPDVEEFTHKQREAIISSFKALFKSITTKRSGERIKLNFEDKRANNSKKSNCPIL